MPFRSKQERAWKVINRLDSEWMPTRILAREAGLTIHQMVAYLIQAKKMKIVEYKTEFYYDSLGYRHKQSYWRKIK